MKFNSCHLKRSWKRTAGFTFIEMMVSVFIGLVILVPAIYFLFINGNQCFLAMLNYQNLDQKSYSGLDLLSREIRGASAVTASTATSLSLVNATLGTTIIVTYSPTAKTLVLTETKSGVTTTVTNLTGCDSWTNSLYSGAPTITNNTLIFNIPATVAQAKMVQMNWTCSRTYIGSKLTTESVQTAQIVLRNKIQP